jgi:molybdopterin/thiamine biosynthesis adenylyltransferase
MTILPKKGSCYRCIFAEITVKSGAMSFSEAGILGPVPEVMGFLQPAEVVKLLLEKDDALYNRIIYYNALDCDFDTIRSLHCNLCGISPT